MNDLMSLLQGIKVSTDHGKVGQCKLNLPDERSLVMPHAIKRQHKEAAFLKYK